MAGKFKRLQQRLRAAGFVEQGFTRRAHQIWWHPTGEVFELFSSPRKRSMQEHLVVRAIRRATGGGSDAQR